MWHYHRVMRGLFLGCIFGVSFAQAGSSPVTDPIPYDGAASVSPIEVTLAWTPDAEAASYQVYLGTATEPMSLVEGVTTSALVLQEELVPGKSYHWRVDSILADQTVVTGDTWTFTTLVPLVADPNLLAWYPLDAGAGDTAWDQSGMDNHATLADMAWDKQLSPPLGGAAVQSTGTGAITLPALESLAAAQGLSLQAWFWLEPSSEQVLLSMSNDSAVSLSCLVSDQRLTLDLLGLKTGGRSGRAITSEQVQAEVVIPSERWTHVVVTIDVPSGTVVVYQGGAEAIRTKVDAVSKLLSPDTDIRFGQHAAREGGYEGAIDQIKVYRRALNAAAAAHAMMHHPATPAAPNPLPWGMIYKKDTVKLRWYTPATALSHHLSWGTRPDQLYPAVETTSRSVSLPTKNMPTHQPIYWQVEAVLPEGCLKSPVWQFSLSDISMDALVKQNGWKLKHESFYGQPVQDVALTDVEGNLHSFSQNLGRHVQVVNWAPWCGWCRKELESIPELRQYAGEDELLIIANARPKEKSSAQPYINQHPEISCAFTFYNYSDLPMPFSDVYYIPANYFVAPDGTLKLSKTGYTTPDKVAEILRAAWEQDESGGRTR